MSQLVLHLMTSLDGFYARPDGDINWHYVDEEHEAIAVKLLDASGLLLFGRVTYEMMAGYWPSAPSDPIADRMNALPKAVISASLSSVDWNGTQLIHGDAAQAVRKLKQQTQGNITVLGSGRLAAALMDARLVDEYHIMVCPIALGSGLSLFSRLRSPHSLTLSTASSRRNGVMDLRYRDTG